MNDKLCSVYIHTNKINGKRYVGITSNLPKLRWNNGNGYKHNKFFTNAIKKYGWDNFTHEIIADGLSLNFAQNLERILIAEYKSSDRRYGYNLSAGGEPMNGKKHSAETRLKMSIAAKNRVVSDETRKKLSDIMKNRSDEQKYKFAHSHDGKSPWCKGLKGKDNPLFGRKRTEAEKNKMAIADMRHFIRHIPTGKIYTSAREIVLTYNISRSQLYRHCNKKVKIPEWEFVEKEAYLEDK